MNRVGAQELTAFVAIAQQSSFTVAAKTLGVSPSALSHSMKNLEARLGVRLFNRTTRSVALTDVGEGLFVRIQPLLKGLERAMMNLVTEQNAVTGVVRLSAPESSLRTLIHHVFPDFLRDNPLIRIECVADNRCVDIVGEGFDAGISICGDVPEGMDIVQLTPNIRFCAVASPKYLARYPAPASPIDLESHHWVVYRGASGVPLCWHHAHPGRTAKINVDGPISVDSLSLMIDSALAGIGVAWVPESHVEEHLESGRLVHLLPEWSPAHTGASLFYPANCQPSPALALFVAAVRAWARNQF